MTEPMKCANCGESIVQMMSRHWKHEFTGVQECRLYAKPMNGITGIKSEDIKPVEYPPLPTSREWLESDGEMNLRKQCLMVGETHKSLDGRAICNRSKGHEGWHSTGGINLGGLAEVLGRWYTDGPFVEAE